VLPSGIRERGKEECCMSAELSSVKLRDGSSIKSGDTILVHGIWRREHVECVHWECSPSTTTGDRFIVKVPKSDLPAIASETKHDGSYRVKVDVITQGGEGTEIIGDVVEVVKPTEA